MFSETHLKTVCRLSKGSMNILTEHLLKRRWNDRGAGVKVLETMKKSGKYCVRTKKVGNTVRKTSWEDMRENHPQQLEELSFEWDIRQIHVTSENRNETLPRGHGAKTWTPLTHFLYPLMSKKQVSFLLLHSCMALSDVGNTKRFPNSKKQV